MKRNAFPAILILSMLAFGERRGTAETAPGSPKGTLRELDAKISLDLDGAAFEDVLKTLEELSGCRFVVSTSDHPGSGHAGAGHPGPVTLNIERVRVRTALDAICDELDGSWSVDEKVLPAIIRISVPESSIPTPASASLDQPISLSLANADVRDVLHACAKLLGARTKFGPGVCGSVTIDIRKTPISKFLDEVCRQVHCFWTFNRTPEPVLRVATAP